jgi:phage RecT family recombinase
MKAKTETKAIAAAKPDRFAGALESARTRFIDMVNATGNPLPWQQEALFALQIIKNNPDLQECNPYTLVDAMAQVAAIGLSLNPATAHVYLIPNRSSIIPWVSYRGLVHLAVKSGCVEWVQADEVFENDHFLFEKGMNPKCEFRPVLKGVRGKRIGAFCVAKLPDGTTLPEFMPDEDLEKARASSKARSSPAWANWGGEMRKKAVIKRASKLWPRAERLQQAIAVMNQVEGSDDIDTPPAIEPTLLLPEQVEALRASLTLFPTLEDKLLRAYGLESIEELPQDQYEEVRQRIDLYADRIAAKEAS